MHIFIYINNIYFLCTFISLLLTLSGLKSNLNLLETHILFCKSTKHAIFCWQKINIVNKLNPFLTPLLVRCDKKNNNFPYFYYLTALQRLSVKVHLFQLIQSVQGLNRIPGDLIVQFRCGHRISKHKIVSYNCSTG